MNCNCVLFSYSSRHNGYKRMHLGSNIYIVRNVIFNKTTLPFAHNRSSLPLPTLLNNLFLVPCMLFFRVHWFQLFPLFLSLQLNHWIAQSSLVHKMLELHVNRPILRQSLLEIRYSFRRNSSPLLYYSYFCSSYASKSSFTYHSKVGRSTYSSTSPYILCAII